MIASLAAIVFAQSLNTLSPSEARSGWKLLFDGKTTAGWHNFKQKGVGPGWQVKDGVLASVDPGTAGDIVTDDKYDWFELTLDYNLTKGGNSGIMVHCADDGDTMWESGPEIQIYDDHGEAGAQKSGWLYDLYSSPVDATKPPGQWNHLDIIISPKKCTTYLNKVKYYEFVWGSEDFFARVAKCKFNQWPGFGKLEKGTIGIQGDHGTVSFRNIKIRTIRS